MAETICLHIGPHKTGSTSIQADAFNHRAALAGRGIDYWSIARNHSFPLSIAFAPQAPGDRRMALQKIEFGTRREIRTRLDRDLKTATGRFVLSAERVTLFPPESLAGLRDFLTGYGPVKLIAYIREPRGWLNSLVLQHLRVGDTLDEALAAVPTTLYRDRLAAARDVFGPENMSFRLFDPTRFEGGSLFSDFMAAIGECDFLVPEELPRNPAVSARAAAILDAVNRAARTAGFKGNARWFNASLRAIGGQPFSLPAETMEPLIARSGDDIAWASEAVGTDLLSLSAPSGAPPLPEPDPDLTNLIFELVRDATRQRARLASSEGFRLYDEDPDMAIRSFTEALSLLPTMREARHALKALRAGDAKPAPPEDAQT